MTQSAWRTQQHGCVATRAGPMAAAQPGVLPTVPIGRPMAGKCHPGDGVIEKGV